MNKSIPLTLTQNYFPGVAGAACPPYKVYSDHDMVAAVHPDFHAQVGCYNNLTLTYNTKKVTVQMVDKCMGCKGNDVDLSPDAFIALVGELTPGRVKVQVETVKVGADIIKACQENK